MAYLIGSRKVLAATLLALTGLALLCMPVAAHVTLDPSETQAGAFVKYTVRVPCERAVPTVRVRVEFPSGLLVSRFMPKEGWEREVEKDSAGRVVAVTWFGGSIAPDEFEEFSFLARNPVNPGRVSWKAFQSYQDGVVVEWTGPEGSERPAPVTLVLPGPSSTPGGTVEGPASSAPSSGAGVRATPSPAVTAVLTPAAREGSGGGPDGALVVGSGALSMLALIVGLVALARSFRSSVS